MRSNFEPRGGYFRFICVEGELECRFSERRGRPHIQWTWDGQDEMDPASGRGRATLQRDGTLKGRIFIRDGDDSTFTATRSGKDLHIIKSPPPYRPRRRW